MEAILTVFDNVRETHSDIQNLTQSLGPSWTRRQEDIDMLSVVLKQAYTHISTSNSTNLVACSSEYAVYFHQFAKSIECIYAHLNSGIQRSADSENRIFLMLRRQTVLIKTAEYRLKFKSCCFILNSQKIFLQIMELTINKLQKSPKLAHDKDMWLNLKKLYRTNRYPSLDVRLHFSKTHSLPLDKINNWLRVQRYRDNKAKKMKTTCDPQVSMKNDLYLKFSDYFDL